MARWWMLAAFGIMIISAVAAWLAGTWVWTVMVIAVLAAFGVLISRAGRSRR